ncbi:MAG: methionyl-tRNA formyltransferase [Ruminococcaceae bacterium]|nr:methionyl-tRNA formyltransferase [Oscillospiraceae bacterium]
MKVVYMGTPDFAVKPLEALIENKFQVVGVFTQPDKPVGRKAVLTPPPVKVVATENNIPVFQPDSLKNGEGVKILQELKPDVVIVVAYGKILPKDFLEFAKYGCINIHGSILPKYRGAAPIQWSVLDGEEYAGVTSMQMNEGLDTGDILLVEKTKIDPDETSGDLYERLTVLGANVLLKTLEAVENGTLKPIKQDDSMSSYAKMLDKSLSKIDWNLSAQMVHNKIRGLDPWPVALTVFEGKNLKLFRSRLLNEEYNKPAGSVYQNKEGIIVVCGDKRAVLITEVQLEGKKRMSASDFSRGAKLTDGTIFES